MNDDEYDDETDDQSGSAENSDDGACLNVAVAFAPVLCSALTFSFVLRSLSALFCAYFLLCSPLNFSSPNSPDEMDDSDEYIAEKVLLMRIKKKSGTRQYLVKVRADRFVFAFFSVHLFFFIFGCLFCTSLQSLLFVDASHC